MGPIDLSAYGAGQIYVSLSKEKLAALRKPTDPSAQVDKEVATDLAVMLCAGLVAERIAEQREGGIIANPVCAEPDHELLRRQLTGAGLSKKFDLHEQAAWTLLEAEWPLVQELAGWLLNKVSADAVEAQEFMQARVG